MNPLLRPDRRPKCPLGSCFDLPISWLRFGVVLGTMSGLLLLLKSRGRLFRLVPFRMPTVSFFFLAFSGGAMYVDQRRAWPRLVAATRAATWVRCRPRWCVPLIYAASNRCASKDARVSLRTTLVATLTSGSIGVSPKESPGCVEGVPRGDCVRS